MNKDFESFYNEVKDNNEIKSVWAKTNEELIRRNKRAIYISIVVLLIANIFIIRYASNFFPAFKLPFLAGNQEQIISGSDIFGICIGCLFVITMNVLIFAIIHSCVFIGATRNYSEQYKGIIIKKLLDNFFDEVEYKPEEKMPVMTYKECNYESFDEYHSEDFMDGIINHLHIQMAEVHTIEVYYERNSEGQQERHERTLFEGLFAKIRLDKDTYNTLKIFAKNNMFLKNRLDMDSQEFEKYFDVSSTSKITGMKVLTHSVMETLLKYKESFGNYFDINIINDNLYIRYSTSNAFESKFTSKEIVDKTFLYNHYNAVKFVSSLATTIIDIIHDTTF